MSARVGGAGWGLSRPSVYQGPAGHTLRYTGDARRTPDGAGSWGLLEVALAGPEPLIDAIGPVGSPELCYARFAGLAGPSAPAAGV
jgi:hypothetical protein